ncbi:MAG: hypothetical protein HY299_16000 [Verrucomicrobia bacterium]|nr:hypothetical protein [Verrucomicrobiota bacterium]
MDATVPFGGPIWWAVLTSLVIGRGADLFSTWVATPNLVLEANPIARWLGWRRALAVNVVICGAFSFYYLPGIIIATTSALVAARNFQQAWLMRTWGEEEYRSWYVERLRETPLGLFLGCLGLQNLLVAGIGGILAWSAVSENAILPVPFGIGLGILTYALTVVFYTLLAMWRIRQ